MTLDVFHKASLPGTLEEVVDRRNRLISHPRTSGTCNPGATRVDHQSKTRTERNTRRCWIQYTLLPTGVEPVPAAWKAAILPLDHGSLLLKIYLN